MSSADCLKSLAPQIRVVLLNWCAWFLRMKKPGEVKQPSGYKNSQAPPHHISSSSPIQVTTIAGQAPSSSPTAAANGDMSVYFGYHATAAENLPFPQGSGSTTAACSQRNVHSEQTRSLLLEQLPEILQILEEVQYIARRFREQDEGEAICSEWKFAAAVVDRLCLVAFSLFSIICTFTILMSAPNFIEAVFKDFT